MAANRELKFLAEALRKNPLVRHLVLIVLTLLVLAVAAHVLMQLGTRHGSRRTVPDFSGIARCFSYILFIRFFEEFAKSDSMPPALAVWLPNILYLLIAVYLYRKAPK